MGTSSSIVIERASASKSLPPPKRQYRSPELKRKMAIFAHPSKTVKLASRHEGIAPTPDPGMSMYRETSPLN